MNIFVLDKSCEKSAEMMIDRHVVKMILESSQMLANAYSNDQLDVAPKTKSETVRKYSYYNHPCSIWTRETGTNFRWLLGHAHALLHEALYRGFNLHFCYEFLDWCKYNEPENLTTNKLVLTEWALAMPDEYKVQPFNDGYTHVIQSYRNYYINDKQRDKSGKWMMFYTKREIPNWIPQDIKDKIATLM